MAVDVKYACKKQCFVGSLIRVGEVVSADIAVLAPSCFVELKAKTKRAIQDELEEIIPEVKEANKGVKLYTSRDLLKAKASQKIAGE